MMRIMAGLGNQMFQYAMGLQLAHRNHAKLVLDRSSYEHIGPEDTPRRYALECFRISPSFAAYSQVPPPYGHRLNRLRELLGVRYPRIYLEKGFAFEPEAKEAPDDTYLIG